MRLHVERGRRAVAELRQRTIVRQQEYRKEVETQLAEVSREVQADAEKFAAQKQDLERIDIRSPAAGHVMGLAVQTVGAVVQPGQKLMDVVPQEQDLLLEAHIAPHLIDKIRVGLSAEPPSCRLLLDPCRRRASHGIQPGGHYRHGGRFCRNGRCRNGGD